MEQVNENVLAEIKKLGAFDLEACYSCGTCSGICPLSKEAASFPRRLLRYAQLGLEKRILAAPEPWLCYYCGECSETCPRQAEPAALMMALRRFATRKYSLGRMADAVYSSLASVFTWLLLSAAAVVAILLAYDPKMNLDKVDFLSFISLANIHDAGIVLTAFIVLAAAIQLWILYRNMRGLPVRRDRDVGAGAVPPVGIAALKAGQAGISAWKALNESVMQKRFGECADDKLRRLAHMAVSWGFMGMFLATLVILGVDYNILPLPRWVSLAIGSVSGVACSLGLGYYFYLRLKGKTAVGKYSHPSDWAFLLLLALSILSGYVMLFFRFMNMPMAAYWTFAFHLVVVFDLLVTFPFSKFAHVIYRPVALFLAGMK
ncbi:MAG: 4Fe-4S dicluster domain-containing protein [Acidobacteria bacterium]|jgi:ferredoxin|nr:4Fe-4S dicluster domain-containing protein [Acidobacteriota bacterium]